MDCFSNQNLSRSSSQNFPEVSFVISVSLLYTGSFLYSAKVLVGSKRLECTECNDSLVQVVTNSKDIVCS